MGTYNSLTGKSQLSDCLACPAGKYCSKIGLSADEGNCDAGYFCLSGSPSQRPNAAVNYGPCPAGKFCVAGTSVPADCLAGTFSAMTLLSANTYCHPCTAGSYCDVSGLSAPAGSC